MIATNDLRAYLDANVNEGSLPTFMRFMNIQDTVQFNTMVELLFSGKINLFQIANIPLMDEENVAAFLANIEAQLSPEAVVGTGGTFVSQPYLFDGNAGSLKTYIAEYTARLTAATIELQKVPDVAYISSTAYANKGAFESRFSALVLPKVKTHVGITGDISSAFPSQSSIYTALTTIGVNSLHADTIAGALYAVIAKYSNALTDADLYKLVASFGGEIPELQAMGRTSFNVLNFNSGLLTSKFQTHMYSVLHSYAVAGRGKTAMEAVAFLTDAIDNIETIANEGDIAVALMQLDFAIEVVRVENAYNNNGVSITAYKNALAYAVQLLEQLKQLFKSTLNFSQQYLQFE